MAFLSGLLLGTFLGFLLAGLCNIVRENREVRSAPVKMAENIEKVA